MNRTETISVPRNVERVQERMRAAQRRAGRAGEITLVAIGKLVVPERIAEAYAAGVRHVGENRVQECEGKRRSLDLPKATWHMVGHLQTNKAEHALELFDRVDSLDSLRLAGKLSAAAEKLGRRLPVLIQVHLGDEPSKHGVNPAELPGFVEQVAQLNALAVKGLMTIPPYLEPPERVRPFFRCLGELAQQIARRRIPGIEMGVLSMGMSHDFEVAIEEGASEVRLGTALFGARPAR
ncbi:MAG: YggS family pyridoxal phosphate-dependent enzyme [Terriglobia bacterium]